MLIKTYYHKYKNTNIKKIKKNILIVQIKNAGGHQNEVDKASST